MKIYAFIQMHLQCEMYIVYIYILYFKGFPSFWKEKQFQRMSQPLKNFKRY